MEAMTVKTVEGRPTPTHGKSCTLINDLTTAVRRVLQGHTRQERSVFIVFRSHYLFESHFRRLLQSHRRGGIEHGVG